jgi:hypothetical protein
MSTDPVVVSAATSESAGDPEFDDRPATEAVELPSSSSPPPSSDDEVDLYENESPPLPTGTEAPAATPLHYCLDPGHSPTYKDETRFFGYEGEGCPTCPTCNKQVSSVPVANLGEYPAIALRLS